LYFLIHKVVKSTCLPRQLAKHLEVIIYLLFLPSSRGED